MGGRPFSFFGLHLRSRGNSHVFRDEDQNLWKYVFFCCFCFLVFTSEVVEIRTVFGMKTRICGNSRIVWNGDLFSTAEFVEICVEHFLRLVHTLKFKYIKFSCPPVTLSWRQACKHDVGASKVIYFDNFYWQP